MTGEALTCSRCGGPLEPFQVLAYRWRVADAHCPGCWTRLEQVELLTQQLAEAEQTEAEAHERAKAIREALRRLRDGEGGDGE